MSYVFAPPPVVALPVRGSDALFPVRRIYCVGRNYAEHAIEMGGDPNRESPFFFQKNADNIIVGGGDFPYPSATKNVHHEIELVVALGKGGENISVDAALNHVFGYAVGLDMTRRDLQDVAKETRRPWEVSKAFESSAPMSELIPASAIGHPKGGAIWLDVNGKRTQTGDLNQLIWKVPEAISYLSGLFLLAAGDLIMTGTPAGVGPVKRGDALHGHIDGIGDLRVRVV
jgi:fumarylpyruvate hydrolase